mgnify:CR=1 FL=1
MEKLLKAVFFHIEEKTPTTHYIDVLARKLNLRDDMIDLVIDLTIDYTFARYPDVADVVPYEQYNKKIAEEKLEKAKSLFKYILGIYNLSEGENND